MGCLFKIAYYNAQLGINAETHSQFVSNSHNGLPTHLCFDTNYLSHNAEA